MLSKGRTTMEGLSGSGSAAGAAWGLGAKGWVLVGKEKYRTVTNVAAMSPG
jgi:hypothetical protein